MLLWSVFCCLCKYKDSRHSLLVEDMTSHFVPVPLIFDLTNEELFVHLRHVCCVYTSQPLCM